MFFFEDKIIKKWKISSNNNKDICNIKNGLTSLAWSGSVD